MTVGTTGRFVCEKVNGAAGALPDGKKLIHLIRHGQGYHNLAAEEAMMPCGCPVGGPCVYRDPQYMDARLTPLGKEQASSVTKLDLTPQVVIVSPLTRTLQTASLAFPKGEVPMLVREEIREVLGQHMCDKRRTLTDIKPEFELPIFGDHLDDEDVLYPSYGGKQEPHEHVWARGKEILEWLAERPEQEIALVSHSGFLRRFMVGSVACDDDELKRPWATGECRSVVIDFSRSS